jgi:hypothetical protein
MDFCLLATGAFRLHLTHCAQRASRSNNAEIGPPGSGLLPLDYRLLAHLARAQREQHTQRPYRLGTPAGLRL